MRSHLFLGARLHGRRDLRLRQPDVLAHRARRTAGATARRFGDDVVLKARLRHDAPQVMDEVRRPRTGWPRGLTRVPPKARQRRCFRRGGSVTIYGRPGPPAPHHLPPVSASVRHNAWPKPLSRPRRRR